MSTAMVIEYLIMFAMAMSFIGLNAWAWANRRATVKSLMVAFLAFTVAFWLQEKYGATTLTLILFVFFMSEYFKEA